MEGHFLIKTILFFGSFFSSVNSKFLCSSEPKCKCFLVKNDAYRADCSRLSLTNVPHFNSNVIDINLSSNNVEEFPKSGIFPDKLLSLDFSNNRLSTFNKDSFTSLKSLKFLKLSSNELCLNNRTYFAGVFDGLRNLQVLNLKDNCIDHKSEEQFYPSEALSKLSSLRELYVDGLNNKKFDSRFSNLRNLKLLDLSGLSGKCTLSYLDSNYFDYLHLLESIDISGCKIFRIYNGTFKMLHNLTHLDISFNEDLTFRVLANVSYDMQYTSINVLKANKIYMTFGLGTEVFVEDLEYLGNTTLKELYLDSNRLQIIHSGVLERLPKSLIHASLADNKFTMGRYIFEVFAVSNVRILNASFQHISHNPRGFIPTPNKNSCDQQIRNMCPGDKKGLFRNSSSTSGNKKGLFQNLPSTSGVFQPEKDSISLQSDTQAKLSPSDYALVQRLQKLFQGTGNVSAVGAIPVPFPPKLETLFFSKCALRYSIPALNFLANNIQYADLSGNILHEWIGPVKYLHRLKFIDLSNNYCSNITTSFFCCVEQLETLLIGNNYLGFVLNKDIEGLTFSRLLSLKTLDISLNRIQQLQPAIFRGLKNLQFLNISNNAVRTWNFEIRQMTNIKHIDFSNNELTTLSKNIRNDLDQMGQNRTIILNLENNNFLCNCDTLDFLKWVAKTKITLSHFDNYTCKYLDSLPRRFAYLSAIVSDLEFKCTWQWVIIIGASVAGSLFIVLVSTFLIYKLRWTFRIWFYSRKIKHNRNIIKYRQLPEANENNEFRYDVFFIYDDEDREFVWNSMLKLESVKLRVCCRERDFIIGSSDFRSMCNAIQYSRKIVIVFSPNFTESKICHFQYELALTECGNRESGDIVFLLDYKPVDFQHTPLYILNLRRREIYMEIPENHEQNEYFGQMLRDRLFPT